MKSRRCNGFTLMEVMMAVFIFGFIALTVYGVLSNAIRARTVSEERAELYALGRETLLRIVADLEGALLPLSGDRIFFEGVSEPASVRFIRMNRGGYRIGGVRPGQVLVEYSVTPPDPRGFRTLVRGEQDFQFLLDEADGVQREESRFDLDDSNDPERQTELYLNLLDCPEGAEFSGTPGACARLAGMRFSFYDDIADDFIEYWDSFEEGGVTEDRIPAAVQIELLLLDENGGEHDFSTVVDLPLARANPTPGATPE